MTQADRIARVAEAKRLPRSAPWMPPVRGTLHTLVADSVTLACLAAGKVPARFQVQCRQAVDYLQLLDEEL